MLKKPFTRICEAAGIPKQLSTKVFRRTWSDLARQANVDTIVKFSMIGHADEGVHRDYSTVEPEEKQQALAKVMKLATGMRL